MVFQVRCCGVWKGTLKFQELIQTRLIKIKNLSGRSDKDHESGRDCRSI